MGIRFSCPGFGISDLDGLEALTVRSISFKGEDVNTVIRAHSFKESGVESPKPNSYGPREMVLEGSLSFKGLKRDPFQVETTFSMPNSPAKDEDFTRTPGFQTSESNFEVVSTKSCVSDRTCSFKSSELNNSQEGSPEPSLSDPNCPKHEAAVKLQKFYKSFRTRRQLADCAVLVEQNWWKLLDFALLKHSSVSFFNVEKPESVVSRWSRARMRAAKVGKGLSKDEKAQKLALQHWLEAIDPRHRYGHNLHLYYDCWLHCDSKQPFFYWLDVGDGKEVTRERCPRWKLQQQCIKYLDPKEREAYEVMVEEGRFIYKQNGQLVNTSGANEDSKWIFVLSTSKSLYVGQKKKGKFQHSSFMAGGATSSAGRLVVEHGILKAIWPHSGHYRPTKENFLEFVSFLRENNVDLTDVKKSPVEEDEAWSTTPRISPSHKSINSFQLKFSQDPTVPGTEDIKQPDELRHSVKSMSSEGKRTCLPYEGESDEDIEVDDLPKNTEVTDETDGAVEEACEQQNGSRSLQGGESPGSPKYRFHKSNLFEEGNDEGQEPSVVPPELILNRINPMKRTESTHLRRQFSFKWTSGTGPRISFVRDYPSELQFRALEQVSLSPRSAESSGVITAVGSPGSRATRPSRSSNI